MVSKYANEGIAAQLSVDREGLSPMGQNTVPGVSSERLAQTATRCRQEHSEGGLAASSVAFP